jgi:anti-sigma factor RsiW
MHNVLEDVVDKEAGAKLKLVGPSSGVGSAVRHISQGELDAYVEGRLSGAVLDFVRAHLDACEACRAELEDLRTFKASAVGLSQASSLKRELERRRRQRQLKAAGTAAIAAAVVAVIGVVGWNKFGKAWWTHTTSMSAATAARAPAVSADTQVRGVAHADNQTTVTAAGTEQVRDARAVAAQPRATPVAQPRGNVVASAVQPQSASVASGAAQQPTQAHSTSVAGGAAQQPTQAHSTSVAGGAAQQPTQAHSTSVAGGAAQQPTQARSASVAGGAAQQAYGTSVSGGAAQQPTQAHSASVAGGAAQQSTPAYGASVAGGAVQRLVQAHGVNAVGLQASASAPQVAAQAHGATPASAGSTSFALLGPFGNEVSDDRPEFTWQPLEGTAKYAIIIVDEGLRPIAHARLKTTTWRPRKPLRRGRTYLWQVTAILKNGTKVMATGPTSQEARMHITAPSK